MQLKRPFRLSSPRTLLLSGSYSPLLETQPRSRASIQAAAVCRVAEPKPSPWSRKPGTCEATAQSSHALRFRRERSEMNLNRQDLKAVTVAAVVVCTVAVTGSPSLEGSGISNKKKNARDAWFRSAPKCPVRFLSGSPEKTRQTACDEGTA